MIRVKLSSHGTYSIKMDKPDYHRVCEIATAYSIPVEATIVAIINRGIDSIGRQVKDANASKTLKQLWDEQGGG